MIIVAQILGLFGATANIISSWQKDKSKILFFLLFDSLFYIFQYLLLGAYSGALTCFVSLIRTISFSYNNNSNKYILYIIISMYSFVGIFTYNGIVSIFPTLTSLFYCLILWQDKPENIRKGSILMFIMWFVYNLFVNAYISALIELSLCISAIIAHYKIDIKSKCEDIL